MTELEVLVPFSALAAAVLVWRHFAKRFADRHAFLRHLAGASTGFAAFIATLAFWFEVTTDPAQSNTTTPALSKEQQRTARPYEKAKNKTLRDIDRMSRSAAREIGVGFAALNNVPPEDHEAFYRCLGDRVRTKSPDLSLHEVMGWCLDEYTHDRDAFLRERASYDYFAVKEQFSLWDGSHRPTVEFIKANMHDPSSFKHVETKYSIQTYNTPPDMIVLTTFRGSNLFGALVTNTWKVRVDLETGKVIEVID